MADGGGQAGRRDVRGNPNVAALAVAGSVGAGLADRFSDLELDCYWFRPPVDADRLGPVAAMGGSLLARWDFDEDDEEWSEDYRVGELDITVSNFLVGSIERFLDDVVVRLSTEPVRQRQLLTGLALTPERFAERLRSLSARPPTEAFTAAETLLAETAALVEAHSSADIGAFREALSERRRPVDPPRPAVVDSSRPVAGERSAPAIVRRSARAILVDDSARLVLIKRTKPGRAPYWTTAGGGIEDADASAEAAMRREIFEELGAEAGAASQVFVLSDPWRDGVRVQHFFVARLVRLDLAARTGPEFLDPSLGTYDVEYVDLRGDALAGIDLRPAELKDFIAANKIALLDEAGLAP